MGMQVADGGCPRSDTTYPRPMVSIQQIEFTTHCNLKCVYCPSPQKMRPHEHLSRENFAHTMKWIRHFVAAGTQRDIWLHGIGESMLHPEFHAMVGEMRAEFPNLTLALSSNGLLLRTENGGEAHCAALARNRVRLDISLHRADLIGDGILNARKAGVLNMLTAGPALEPVDWAGQLKWASAEPRRECHFMRQGVALVYADGRITTCCVDARGYGVFAHVADDPAPGVLPMMKLHELCGRCRRVP